MAAPKQSKRRVLPRVLCVVGATSSGKTDFGIALAKKFNGEVINADARQIYKDFTIGTGKPDGKPGMFMHQRVLMIDGVPHHLMDFLDPHEVCTVAEWCKKALALIKKITARGHLPIVVGGTGLYIQALIDNYKIPAVPPQLPFREAMEAKSLDELVALLKNLDLEAVNIVDVKNRRRVLRALEIVTFTGKPLSKQRIRRPAAIDPLLVGIRREREDLRARIDASIDEMVRRGWVDEVRRLHGQGIPWDAPAMTSLGYREFGAYLREECSLADAVAHTKQVTKNYAKRQITWFKRDARIHWVTEEPEAKRLVKRWLADAEDPALDRSSAVR